jgi:hypothetical protein
MAIENAIDCFYTTDLFPINFNNNSPNVGEFWYSADELDPLQVRRHACVEITLNTDEPASSISAITEYASCYECYGNNYGVYIFRDCFGNFAIPLVIDVSAVTPSFFSTFSGGSCYIECEILNIPVIGCFFSDSGPQLLPKQVYDNIQAQLNASGAEIINNVLGITAYTVCEECLLNSPIVYEVENCVTKNIHLVQLPNTINEGLISYTDGTEEFCGTILQSSTFPVPSYTFVSFYGKVECEVCLSERNKKYIIANCVDSGIQEVVWGSQLFQNGSVSNLQQGGGCYEVLGETTDPVTIPLFLDFEPQPTCTSCLECNGVYYEYAYCNEPTIKVGEILSYQIIPAGSVFYHPNEDLYVLRLNAIPQPIVGINLTLYSAIIGNNCFSVVPPVNVWTAVICGLNIEISLTIIGGGGNMGEIRQVLWGENELFCVELIQEGSSNTNSFVSTSTIYNSCEECTSGTTIGLRTVNCYNQEVEVVDLSYSAWTQVTYFGGLNQNDGFNYNCFLDTDEICRTVPEFCPTTPTGNLKTLNEQYFNCPICVAINPEPQPQPDAISAGTEYTVCQVCCPCSSNQSIKTVSVPHPQWTNAQGRTVVLTDAVVLGGMYGLNS